MKRDERHSAITKALSVRRDAVSRVMGNEIESLFPDKSVVFCKGRRASANDFAADGRCSVSDLDAVRSDWNSSVYPNRESYEMHQIEKNTWLAVEWGGQSLEVVTLTIMNEHRDQTLQWVIAESSEIAFGFLEAIHRWNRQIVGEVLVFSNGCWSKSERLFESIKSASFEDLILGNDLKKTIREDINQFFQAKPMYDQYDIPWKRGIILTGPPGNGKTMIIRAIINETKVSCLYVQDLISDYGRGTNVAKVFQRAREQAPCILVLEDIDSLLNDKNRSQFLNEVDGFGQNTGILILATTNHPERLDPALLNRPSRFDRKYELPLPGLEERERFLVNFSAKFDENLHLSPGEAGVIANQTDEFSYAFLRELILSSMMSWIANPSRLFVFVVESTIPVLRDQLRAGAPEMPNQDLQDDDEE